jgi:signal transduction histidine kinase
MKVFAQGILAKRKIVLIFLLAILLPSLIVGYLSLGAFSKRREAVKRLLESNLWISGESALRSVEGALLEYEKEALRPENFTLLTELKGLDQFQFNAPVFPTTLSGTPFLLDDEYQIIFPKTGSEQLSMSSSEEIAPETDFSKEFKRAEFYEFSQKNFSRAAQSYRKCALNAPSSQQKALAMEALGRCLLSGGNHEEAYRVYNELSTKFGQIQDKAGHHYGISAALQIYEIEKHRKREESGLHTLLNLYKDIKDGNWLISLPAYDFFVSEIESTLDTKFEEGQFPEIQKSYQAQKNLQSPYLQALVFAEFLKKDVVPRIKEKLSVSSIRGSLQAERLLANQSEGFCLVSYSLLPDFQERRTFYGGFCWNLESLKKGVLPGILGEISKNTGLRLENIGENSRETLPKTEESTSKDSLVLSYRQFPLPWKLLVTQPALNDLERTARRENFFYGALLTFIVVLMLLGAFLLARDISRESETTRLKTEFVNNISHELKTPLTLIRLYGETLQRKENLTEAERKESYEIITKESERLSHLINNVLDFSRIDMGRKEFNFTRGSLSQVVQETLDSYRYHLGKKGFVVKEEIAPDLPEMNFDGEAVASVLVNLLSNVMKFSPNEKEVTVRLFRRNGQAVLQVADKGVGISPQDRSRIFKRFYRAKNDVVSETRGSGLGLTLVKHITEAHSGTIEVESEPGKGSVFSIILPISGPEKE